MKHRVRALALILILLLSAFPSLCEEEEVSLFPAAGASSVTAAPREEAPAPQEDAPEATAALAQATPAAAEGEQSSAAREELIDRMIDLAQDIYRKTNGRAQKANSPGDIYVCKNFTVHLFRKNRDDYRMAAFPDVPLVIPNNLPAKQSKPYSYGISWEEIAPEKGNPFEIAAQFFYNRDESAESNRERAMEFMRKVKRGDFFQMSAQYYYGIGAHSLVFIRDYDPDTDTVTWTDSNMKGETRGGVRYGYVQFEANRKIEWFVDAFCKKGRGATLYRLRDDIIKR